MKNLICINMVAAVIIVLGYPAIFETIMFFGGIILAAIGLILSIFVIGYVNILTIGAALYTILTSIKYLQHH